MKSEKSAFCDVLSELRVSGAIVLSETYSPPWAIKVPDGKSLATILGLKPNTSVVPFHIVTQGSFEYIPDQGHPSTILKDEIVICTNGNGHTMKQGTLCDTETFENILKKAVDDDQDIDIKQQHTNKGHLPENNSTQIICGAFLLQNAEHNPLLRSLPKTLHLKLQGEDSPKALSHIFTLLSYEIQSNHNGQSYMLERQLEMLYAESIRSFCQLYPEEIQGWLKAAQDPRISKVLSFIHNNITESLSVSTLANLIHMSPSRFSAHFKNVMSIAPMSYVANWRLQKSAIQLKETQWSITQVALNCGYQSLPAFNRAFTKQFQTSPSLWRKSFTN